MLFAHRVYLMIYLVFIGILMMSISWAIVWSCDKVEKNNSEFSLETEEFVSFADSAGFVSALPPTPHLSSVARP